MFPCSFLNSYSNVLRAYAVRFLEIRDGGGLTERWPTYRPVILYLMALSVQLRLSQRSSSHHLHHNLQRAT